MRLPVHVEPLAGMPPDVDYRWDPDTEILSARVQEAARPREGGFVGLLPAGDGAALSDLPLHFGPDDSLSGAVELEGRDGSWIVLDVERGRLAGIEVAVWPSVRRRHTLAPPTVVVDAHVRVTGRRGTRESAPSQPASLEVTTQVTAESDATERTIHFQLGPARQARSVRLGRDLLVDVDTEGHLAGLWLLNVPPVPTVT
ncbi:MAG TPA: hypothetical protein VFT96_07215 [Gemmatimonadaceae bacterium]|nr:hypothetical protein [Gemmatimonadaceae bacterium]